MHATEPGLLWAAVTRNKTVLAECGVITSAEDSRAGAVVDLAQQILKKKPTPGWEFARARGLSAVKFHVHDAHEQSAGAEIVWAVSCVHDAGFDGTLVADGLGSYASLARLADRRGDLGPVVSGPELAAPAPVLPSDSKESVPYMAATMSR